MATTNLYFVSSISGNVSTPNNALGAPNAVFTTDTDTNTPWTHEWALDTVSGSAIGTQTFTLRVRKGSNTGDPTVTSIILKQDGVAVTANLLGSTFTVTSTTGEDIQVTTSGTLNTIANLSLEIVTSGTGGSPSAINAVSIDAVTYLADYLPPIFGTFAATETGDDTISSTGKVIVQGIMSSEGALDTASFIGQVYRVKNITLSPQKIQSAYFEAILPPLVKIYRLSNAA